MRNQTIILVLAAGSGVASANGFVVNEHDARATGRADASAASDTGPSSIYYSPGGVAVEHRDLGRQLADPARRLHRTSTRPARTTRRR